MTEEGLNLCPFDLLDAENIFAVSHTKRQRYVWESTNNPLDSALFHSLDLLSLYCLFPLARQGQRVELCTWNGMKCPGQPLIFPADFEILVPVPWYCLHPLKSPTSYVPCMMGYLDLDISAEIQEWRHPSEPLVFGSTHPKGCPEILEGWDARLKIKWDKE